MQTNKTKKKIPRNTLKIFLHTFQLLSTSGNMSASALPVPKRKRRISIKYGFWLVEKYAYKSDFKQ